MFETDLGFIRDNLKMASRFKSISSTASMAHCRKANERLLRCFKTEKLGLVNEGKFVPFGRSYSKIKKQIPKSNQRLFEKVQFGYANPELHDSSSNKMVPKETQEAIELVCQNVSSLFGFDIDLSQTRQDIDLEIFVQEVVRSDLEATGIRGNSSPNELTFEQEAVVDDILHIADAAEEIGIHFDIEEYLDLGRAAEIRGNLFSAERYYREVMKHCRQIQDYEGEIDALIHIGSVAYSRGDLDELNRLYKEVLLKSERIEYASGKFVAYSGLGLRSYEMGQFDEAEENYRISLSILDEIDDDFASAIMLINRSLICVQSGDFSTAESMITSALEIFQKIDRLDGESKALSHMASLKGILGHHKEALTINLTNLEHKRELGDAIGEAGMLMEIGVNQESLNNLEVAKKYFKQSLELSRKIGHRKVECASLGNLGRLNKRNSNYRMAESNFLEALQIAREVQNANYIVISLQNLGILFRRMKDYEKAEKYFLEALESSISCNLELSISSCQHSLGILYRESGDLEKSVEFMEKSIATNVSNKHNIEVANTYRSMGLTLHELNKSDKAIDMLKQAISVFQKIDGNTNSIASSLRSLARVYGDIEVYESAKEALLESLDISIRAGDKKSEAMCYHELGFLEWKFGNHGKVEQYYSQSLEINRKGGFLLGEADVLRDMARNTRLENPEKSEQLLASCNKIRSQIGLESLES